MKVLSDKRLTRPIVTRAHAPRQEDGGGSSSDDYDPPLPVPAASDSGSADTDSDSDSSSGEEEEDEDEFDANPVVASTEAEEADLVLVVGTSLSGLNSDQLATTPASKSLGPLSARRGRGGCGSDTHPRLGTVIINLQQTPEDGKASLRLFSTADIALTLVLDLLGIACPAEAPAFLPSPTAGRVRAQVGRDDQTRSLCRRVLVPYDRDGVRIPREARGTTPRMWLDLRDGARIKLGAHHNCQGARQPAYIRMGRAGKTGVPGDAAGTVRALDSEASSLELLRSAIVFVLEPWGHEKFQSLVPISLEQGCPPCGRLHLEQLPLLLLKSETHNLASCIAKK